MKGIKLFVYGTLRKGYPNHYYLKNAKFLGYGKTKEKFAMYAEEGIPYVIREEKVSPIFGELYEVDEKTLYEIDDLEGHPEEYKREKTRIILENGEEIEAWMYFYPEKLGILVKTGNFEDYIKEFLSHDHL